MSTRIIDHARLLFQTLFSTLLGPYSGVLVYCFLGDSRRDSRRFRKKNKQKKRSHVMLSIFHDKQLFWFRNQLTYGSFFSPTKRLTYAYLQKSSRLIRPLEQRSQFSVRKILMRHEGNFHYSLFCFFGWFTRHWSFSSDNA